MEELKKVYAYQIKDSEKYNGRYIVLIKQQRTEDPFTKDLYKVKLTKDNVLPKTKEEIDKCEFVKMRLIPYELRVFPLSGSLSYEKSIELCKDDTLPDEDNNLFNYDYEFIFTRKEKKSSLIYIGEFDVIDKPSYEKRTEKSYCPAYGYISDLECQVLEGYEDNNLRNSIFYKGNERQEYVDQTINTIKEAREFAKKWVEENMKNRYNYSFGYKLLDSDIVNMGIDDYKKHYSKDLKSKDILEKVLKSGKDILNDKIDSSLYIIGIAYQMMKCKKVMTKDFKKRVNSAINKDLKYWKYNDFYNLRQKELEKFRTKVNEYEGTTK